MVSRVGRLTCALVATLALCPGSQALGPTYITYTTQASPITAVAAADRVSDTQLFQRQVTISTASRKRAAFLNFEANLPGRFFVTYSDKTPADDTTFATMKISGSSEGAVGFVTFSDTTKDMPLLMLGTKSAGFDVTSADSLLIEVEVYKKNGVRSVHSAGICDTVVLADVLYTPSANGSYTSDDYNRTEIWTGFGKFFVSDPSLKLGAFDIDVIAPSNYSVQVEVGQIDAGRAGDEYWDPLTLDCSDRCNVAVFAEKLSPLTVIYMNETYGAASSVCVSSKADVNVTTQIGDIGMYGSATETKTWKIVPNGGSCTKLPLPDRVPGVIGDYGYAPAASKNPASGLTPGASSSAASTGGIATLLAGAIALAVAAIG